MELFKKFSVLNTSFGTFVKVMLTYVSFWPPFRQILSNKENSLIYRSDCAEEVHCSDSNPPPIWTILLSETQIAAKIEILDKNGSKLINLGYFVPY